MKSEDVLEALSVIQNRICTEGRRGHVGFARVLKEAKELVTTYAYLLDTEPEPEVEPEVEPEPATPGGADLREAKQEAAARNAEVGQANHEEIKAFLRGETDELPPVPAVAGSPVGGPPVPEPTTAAAKDPVHVEVAIEDPDEAPAPLAWRDYRYLCDNAAETFKKTGQLVHWSVASVFAQCPGRWVLTADVTEVPAWWFVGGTAVHDALATGRPFDVAFEAGIKLEEEVSGIPAEQWRAAKRGAEGRDWWDVAGPDLVSTGRDMLAKAARDGWRMIGSELSGMLMHGEFTVMGTADAILEREGVRKVIDYKAGATRPSGPGQLGEYAHMFNATEAEFWMLRRGEVLPVNVEAAWPIAHMTLRIMSTALAESNFPLLPGKHCWSCPAKSTCPATV